MVTLFFRLKTQDFEITKISVKIRLSIIDNCTKYVVIYEIWLMSAFLCKYLRIRTCHDVCNRY